MIMFDEKTHTYYDHLGEIPGVTKIIGEILGKGWQASKWYLQRGKAIHACAALIAQGKKFKYDERLKGYIAALEKFFAEVKPELKFGFGERIVTSKLYRFAGTIDLPCGINKKYSIIDYKHSFDMERLRLQLGGYSQAMKEETGIEINIGYGVRIQEDGNYQMTRAYDLRIPRNEFIAIRTVYGMKERMKLNCGQN